MIADFFRHRRRALTWLALLPLCLLSAFQAGANPTGGTVTQGSATFNSSGSTFNINQSSANAFINWQSFNVGAGETVNFNQPSAQSVTFNQINQGNASQILGDINANGYVVLENASGFYIGGQAVLDVHGLLMTTAVTPAMNLSDGGPWSFDAPPPRAEIANYGKINITGGGTAFLIAADIVNGGTICAPNGHIGLYDGETVLVSTSPNGQGLSAAVTLPQGSVDNEGKLTANGGSVVAQAQFVNQNGIIQANTAESVNGTVELLGGSSVTLGANSVISAQGSAEGVSSGGSVTIQAGNTFSDQPDSTINVAGGAQGGNGGRVEISAPQMGNAINTVIDGEAQNGFTGGTLTIDPYSDIWLDSADNAPSGYTFINVNSFSGMSEINLEASDDIVLNTVWQLTAPQTGTATLNLTAGNDIILEDGSGISAGQNWTVNLTAGTGFVPTSGQPAPASGSDGIYLDGAAYIQAQNGNINLWAANEVQVGWMEQASLPGTVNSGSGSIFSSQGGNINVTTLYGDINTGSGTGGFNYTSKAPYYTVSDNLGGISTASGGNVTIIAGGNVISYTPSSSDASIGNDPGTGAFGTESGNVTIIAGENVYGHYVLANGMGTIIAENGNVGTAITGNQFALSLIDGTWNVNAPNGNIYLTEVRNPNGDYNTLKPGLGQSSSTSGQNLFTYGADDAVDLTAGEGVYLTDSLTPRLGSTAPNSADLIPVIYPSILEIIAGAGGVTLDGDVTLFPSVDQNLDIITTDGGSLVSDAPAEEIPVLLMSDSSQTRWDSQLPSSDVASFSDGDFGNVLPTETQPVIIDISGNIGGPELTSPGLDIFTTKETDITVGGNMINTGFSGQNLSVDDVTTIDVAGQIYNSSAYSFVNGVTIPSIPANDLVLNNFGDSWEDIFALAVNPSELSSVVINTTTPPTPSEILDDILQQAGLFSGLSVVNGEIIGDNPGFVYNPATGQLGFGGQMTAKIENDLDSGTLTVLHLVNGQAVPILNSQNQVVGYETDTITWAPASAVETLYADSQGAPSPNSPGMGYQIGGPGEFDIIAGSISLGDTTGILSLGVGNGDDGYGVLAPLTPSGATVNVTVTGPDTSQGASLNMLTSAIAALGGGDVNVTSEQGSMDLGIEALGLSTTFSETGIGIYSTGGGNVNVIAAGDVDVDGSRIATYNAGNIFVESLTGDVNVGSGSSTYNNVYVAYVDPVTGLAGDFAEKPFGSGIDAETLVPASDGNGDLPPNPATAPGNITVETPEGSIISSQAGILQESLSGSLSPGPTITLTAGTFPSGTPGQPGYTAGYAGNIDLGNSGVIGGTVSLSANGNIIGQIVSSQNTTVNAAQSFSGTILAAGSASVTGGGTISGTIIGVGGANVSGLSVTASVLGQNVSVNGGAAQSTLGASATATTATQAAAQQASSQSQQTVVADQSDQDDKKKKNTQIRKVGHVTVILASAAPQ